MAQGDIITPEVEQIITEIWQEHVNKGWTAKEIQSEVAKRIQLKWPSRYKLDWPGLRAVQDRLAKIKDNFESEEFQKLEASWHLYLMRMPEYQIPPEVVPDILAVQEWCVKEHPDVPLFKSEPLTIRQALWIARLYGITRLLHAGKAKGKNKSLDITKWLWLWSKAYAQYEILCYLSGTPPDTTKLDKAIWNGATPIAANNAVDLLYPDTSIWETVIEINEKDGEK